MNEVFTSEGVSPYGTVPSPRRTQELEEKMRSWRRDMENYRKSYSPEEGSPSCPRKSHWSEQEGEWKSRGYSPRWKVKLDEEEKEKFKLKKSPRGGEFKAKEEEKLKGKVYSPRWRAKLKEEDKEELKIKKSPRGGEFKAEEKEKLKGKVYSPRWKAKLDEEEKEKFKVKKIPGGEEIEEEEKEKFKLKIKNKPEGWRDEWNKGNWRRNCLKEELESGRGEFLRERFFEKELEKHPQACISKSYINLAEALTLNDYTLGVEVLTSSSAVFIDIEKVIHHFPNLQAGYNIFINVCEGNAELIRKLDLTYGLFVLDPVAPELTLTALLPHLRADGYYVFFYNRGMISLFEDTLVVRETEMSENILKLVRSPNDYPCKMGSWHSGVWKVYGVNLKPHQAECLDKVASEGTIKMEHICIKNENNMIYGDWCLRQFVEALVLSLRCVKMPVFVLSGIGSVPLIETIIHVYAQENGLFTDGGNIRLDLLMESWIGDEIPGCVATPAQIKEYILCHRCDPGHYHKLMLRDPLLVKVLREEQDLFVYGKPFSVDAPFSPRYLE